MRTPIKRVLNILNRELKISNSNDTKSVLSKMLVEIETNIVPLENATMSDIFDTGFSLGSDAVLNDKPNINGVEWVKNYIDDKIILCEICDSEIIPECEYSDCPYKS